jgi:hypothetical protein
MPSGEKRRLVILGAVLGLLVAAFAAKTFLLSDSSSKPSASSSFAPGASDPFSPPSGVSSTTAAHATTTAATAPPPTFQVYATKNPFEPVISLSTGETTTTPPGGTGETTTTASPSNEPPPGQVVTLLDVFTDTNGATKAKVQVGSTVYTVGEGDTFADGQYRVVSLDSPCGQFLFGDSPFRLCEGEQTIK